MKPHTSVFSSISTTAMHIKASCITIVSRMSMYKFTHNRDFSTCEARASAPSLTLNEHVSHPVSSRLFEHTQPDGTRVHVQSVNTCTIIALVIECSAVMSKACDSPQKYCKLYMYTPAWKMSAHVRSNSVHSPSVQIRQAC